MKPILIDATTADLDGLIAALDRRQFARIEQDLITMMLRHGRGKIIGICVEAIRRAESEGAKW